MVLRCAYHVDTLLRLFGLFFSQKMNLVIFRPAKLIDTRYMYFVCTTPATVLCRFLRNFDGVYVRVKRYAYNLNMILKLLFVTFFTS